MTVRVSEMNKNDTLITINQLYKILGMAKKMPLNSLRMGLAKKNFLKNQIVF